MFPERAELGVSFPGLLAYLTPVPCHLYADSGDCGGWVWVVVVLVAVVVDHSLLVTTQYEFPCSQEIPFRMTIPPTSIMAQTCLRCPHPQHVSLPLPFVLFPFFMPRAHRNLLAVWQLFSPGQATPTKQSPLINYVHPLHCLEHSIMQSMFFHIPQVLCDINYQQMSSLIHSSLIPFKKTCTGI